MVVLYTFYSSVFDLKYKKTVTIAIIAAFALLGIATVHASNAAINIAITILTFIAIALLFRGGLLNRLFLALLLYVVAAIGEFIVAYSITFYSDIIATNIQFGTSEFAYGQMLSKLIFAFFVWILLRFFRKQTFSKVKPGYWVVLIIPPIGGIVVLYNFLLLRTHSVVDVVTSFVVMITSVIALTVYDRILTNYEIEAQNIYLEELLSYSSYQYYMAEKSEKLILKTKHDIKNLLIGFQTDIQSHNIDSVQENINKLLEEINTLEGPAASGNLVIDSIINYKAHAARQSDIYFTVDLSIPQNLIIDSVGICQIIGNALDNAIEATEKINDIKKKIIQISASYKQGSLHVKIINPYSDDIVLNRNGKLMSSKRQYRTEGLGLQSIIGTIEKYDGSYDMKYQNGEFCLSVIFYNV